MTQNVRILLVDDFEPFLRHEISMLRENPKWQIIGEATDGLEAVQKVDALRPDLVLLDVGLPKLNGIEVARQIRVIAPRTKIVFVSQECSLEVVAEAFGVGARGYVLKIRAGWDLLGALESVLKDGEFVSPGLISDE